MTITERISYALIGALFGGLIGVACWWLYGLAYSLNYYGPGIDPVLRHWVICISGSFAAVGFLFGERVGDLVGDTINAIFHFEINQAPDGRPGFVVGLGFLAIVIAATWFTSPS